MVIEVKRETRMPIIKVRAKPLTEPEPNQKRIEAVIRDETLLSRTELQAR